MPELTEKVDRLERAIMELVYVQRKTEMEIQSLKHVHQIKKKVERLFKFFPEYASREIIP